MKKILQRSIKGLRRPTAKVSLLTSIFYKTILAALAFLPALTYALGLGALTTTSSLNQPFEGKISLLNASSEELETLTVELGSIEQFKDAGIERPFLLSALKFEVVGEGTESYLKITSDEVIKEPYLNFLLEVNWAKGRLIREYTALLDPVVFDNTSRIVENTDTVTTAPETTVPETTPIKEPVAEVTRAVPAPIESRHVPKRLDTQAPIEATVENTVIETPPEVLAASDPEPVILSEVVIPKVESSQQLSSDPDTLGQLPDATYISEAELNSSPHVEADDEAYEEEPLVEVEEAITTDYQDEASHTTKRGDTLWEIASDKRPSRSVSIQQMMIALLNTNPSAFADNNINVLKTGQVLRIPDQSEITQLSKSEAIALVREHNQLWDDYRQGLASSVATRPVGAVSSTGTSVEETIDYEEYEEPELRLVTATDETIEGEGSGGGSELAEEKQLQDELVLANEQLASGESETAELKDKLRESEEIADLLDQQIELKNEQLSAIQQQLRESSQAASEEEQIAEDSSILEEEESSTLEEELGLTDDEDLTSDDEGTVYLEEDPLVALDSTDIDSTGESDPLDDLLEEEGAAVVEEEVIDEAESISDILADLEGGDSANTIYLNEEDYEAGTSQSDFIEPSEELTNSDPIESPYEEETELEYEDDASLDSDATEEELTSDNLDSDGLKGQIKSLINGLIPASLMDKIPGGLKTVLGAAAAVVLFLLLAIFKLFRGGKKEEAETIDLLDPTEIEEAEEVASTAQDAASEEPTITDEEVAIDSDELKEESVEFDLDFEEELELGAGLDSVDIEALNEEEYSTEGLTNLEDTLEQIKPLLEASPNEEAEEDPLEEVNLSLAYEQFDKAEALVKKAIEEHPEEEGYKLRLLEVHYAANNLPAYEESAKSLFDMTKGEGHLWDSAVSMWAEMSPTRGLFEGSDSATAMGASDEIELTESSVIEDEPASVVDLDEDEPFTTEVTSVENELGDTVQDELQQMTDDGVFELGDLEESKNAEVDLANEETTNLSSIDLMGQSDEESMTLESSEIDASVMIDITSADSLEDSLDKSFEEDDFLNNLEDSGSVEIDFPEMELSEEKLDLDLNETTPALDEENSISAESIEDKLSETMDSLSSNIDLQEEPEMDFSSLDLDEETSDTLEEHDTELTNIDMLDITAISHGDEEQLVEEGEAQLSSLLDADVSSESDHDFLSDVSATLTTSESTQETSEQDFVSLQDPSIAETIVSTSHLDNELDEADILSMTSDESLGLTGDEDLETLAKSLEETLSGFDNNELDDLSFEFDADGTLASTLSGSLSSGSEQELDHEGDEIDTKLNLAKAYIELGDADGAKDILEDISTAGNDTQKKEAYGLLQQIG